MEIENSSERLIWRKKKYSVVFCLRGKNQMVQQKQYYCFLDSNKLMVRCWPQNFVLFSHVFSINFDLPMKFSFRPYKFDRFKQSKHLFSYLAVDKSVIIYCKTYFIKRWTFTEKQMIFPLNRFLCYFLSYYLNSRLRSIIFRQYWFSGFYLWTEILSQPHNRLVWPFNPCGIFWHFLNRLVYH